VRRLPPLLHRQAEDDRHRRPRGALPPEVRNQGAPRRELIPWTTDSARRSRGRRRSPASWPTPPPRGIQPNASPSAASMLSSRRFGSPISVSSASKPSSARRAKCWPTRIQSCRSSRVTMWKAYGPLRYESGVHRVQRVPVTEQQGRIHTSAATVAVLPEAEEVDLKIEDKDLRIDVFRSGGPGGQSVNTTDSAVRITHLPTGLEVKCQDQKSQLQNKIKAMEILRSRLLDRMVAEQEAERARARKSQVGTGDRSQKVRTYNFPQNRVTDHRIHFTTHNIDEVMDGRLDELIAALKEAQEKERAGV